MVATPQTEPQFRIRVETEGTVLYRRRIICDDPDKVSLANHLRQQRRHVNSVTVLQIGMIVEVHATTSWPALPTPFAPTWRPPMALIQNFQEAALLHSCSRKRFSCIRGVSHVLFARSPHSVAVGRLSF